jgi:hypothetical protein
MTVDMYRDPPPVVFDLLAKRLAPFGFVAVDGRWLHRKTWNTNRGVALVTVRSESELGDAAARLRSEASVVLKHSWWSQLGLQIVFQVEGAPLPSQHALAPLIDRINHQGVLVQSVFAVELATGASIQERTWGQLVTGKYQDAIAAALEEFHGLGNHPLSV